MSKHHRATNSSLLSAADAAKFGRRLRLRITEGRLPPPKRYHSAIKPSPPKQARNFQRSVEVGKKVAVGGRPVATFAGIQRSRATSGRVKLRTVSRFSETIRITSGSLVNSWTAFSASVNGIARPFAFVT